MRRPESPWLYRARVALAHSELPAWLAFVAVGILIGVILAWRG